MPILLHIFTNPRRALAQSTRRNSLAFAVFTVLGTSIFSMLCSILSSVLFGATNQKSHEVLIAATLPFLFVTYWLGSAYFVDTGARLMNAISKKRQYLIVSSLPFFVLNISAIISFAQAAIAHVGGTSAENIATILGWFTFPVLIWFFVLLIVAISFVYEISPLPSLSLALLPSAIVTTALLIVILLISVLHAVNVL
jgi:hypothetical protein